MSDPYAAMLAGRALLDPLLHEEIQHRRYAPGFRDINGEWVTGPLSLNLIRLGIVEPHKDGSTRNLNPEGLLSLDNRTFYLPTTDVQAVADDNEGDLLHWDGRDYRVTAAAKWGNTFTRCAGITDEPRDAVPSIVQIADVVPPP